MNSTATRELEFRAADGVEVALLGPIDGSRVLVRVADGSAGRSFGLSAEGGKALDGFYHPFVYAGCGWLFVVRRSIVAPRNDARHS
jgi:hypothetical protein